MEFEAVRISARDWLSFHLPICFTVFYYARVLGLLAIL
jgi:hypothetical protein